MRFPTSAGIINGEFVIHFSLGLLNILIFKSHAVGLLSAPEELRLGGGGGGFFFETKRFLVGTMQFDFFSGICAFFELVGLDPPYELSTTNNLFIFLLKFINLLVDFFVNIYIINTIK